MADFRDQTLLDLADPARLTALLTGTPGHTDQAQAQLMGMLARSYELPSTRIDHISAVSIAGLRLQEALHTVSWVQGSVSQTVPAQMRSDIQWCETGALTPIWIDLLADLQVSLVAEVDPGGIDTVLLQSLDTFTTLDDFRSQFQFLDLDAFMAEHDLHTVEELRAAFHYLRGEIHLRIPPTFDPADPANTYSVRLVAALQIADPPDLTSLLQWARLVEDAAARTQARRPTGLFGEVLCPYAPMAVLSATAVQAAGLDPAALQQFFVTAGIASVLYPPQ
jgi:hypothetical protein